MGSHYNASYNSWESLFGGLIVAHDPLIVGNVPRKISKYIWYAMHHGAKIIGKVRSDKRKRSPLANGGPEIIIEIEVDSEHKEKLPF